MRYSELALQRVAKAKGSHLLPWAISCAWAKPTPKGFGTAGHICSFFLKVNLHPTQKPPPASPRALLLWPPDVYLARIGLHVSCGTVKIRAVLFSFLFWWLPGEPLNEFYVPVVIQRLSASEDIQPCLHQFTLARKKLKQTRTTSGQPGRLSLYSNRSCPCRFYHQLLLL